MEEKQKVEKSEPTPAEKPQITAAEVCTHANSNRGPIK